MIKISQSDLSGYELKMEKNEEVFYRGPDGFWYQQNMSLGTSESQELEKLYDALSMDKEVKRKERMESLKLIMKTEIEEGPLDFLDGLRHGTIERLVEYVKTELPGLWEVYKEKSIATLRKDVKEVAEVLRN